MVVGETVKYLGVEYEISDINDENIVIAKKGNEKYRIVVAIGSKRYNNIFNIDSEDAEDIEPIVQKQEEVNLEDLDIDDEDIEEGNLYNLVTSISEIRSKKAKSEYLEEALENADEELRKEILTVLWLYSIRRYLFNFNYEKMIWLSMNHEDWFQRESTDTEVVDELISKYLETDEDPTDAEYEELLRALNKNEKNGWIITIGGFLWEDLNLSKKAIDEILETWEED